MKSKIKFGKRSPTAQVLFDRLWRQRVVQSKKIYNRKKTKPLNGAFDLSECKSYKVPVTMCVGLASGNPYPHRWGSQIQAPVYFHLLFLDIRSLKSVTFVFSIVFWSVSICDTGTRCLLLQCLLALRSASS